MKYKYIEDPYKKELETSVKETKGNKLELKDTIFYPKGGGQLGDEGKIVKNNQIFKIEKVRKENGKVIHYLEEEGLKKEDKVKCELVWERRYKMMKSHTAAHIISAVVNQETGAKITGNQLDLDKIRIDFSLEEFDRNNLQKYVAKANQIIKKGLEVEDYIIERDELEKKQDMVQLAKGIPASIKKVRIVKIGDFDRQPDGGLHIKNTNEIGNIELIDCKNKGKSNRRIYIKLKNTLGECEKRKSIGNIKGKYINKKGGIGKK